MSTETESALLDALRERPEDRSLYQVYADWLLDRGQPLGTWIARNLDRHEAVRTTALPIEDRRWLAEHAAAVLGPFAWWLDGQHDARGRALTWRRGFLEGVTIRGRFAPLAPVLRAALASPVAPMLHTLAVDSYDGADASVAEALVDTTVPFETLHLDSLDVEHPSTAALLARDDWPLRTLRIDRVRPRGARELLEAVARSPLLRQLRVLMLPLFSADVPATVHELITHAPAFAHLERLELPPYIAEHTELEEARQSLPQIVGHTLSSPGTTVRDVRFFEPPWVCPACAAALEGVVLDEGRLVCSTCGRSFEPVPSSGEGHPGPPAGWR